LQGKGLCGKRSISDVLIFWLLFYQENGEALLSSFKKKINTRKKVTALFRRRMSRTGVHQA
jgi:hypothetical protein